jgi:hypothetical protein
MGGNKVDQREAGNTSKTLLVSLHERNTHIDDAGKPGDEGREGVEGNGADGVGDGQPPLHQGA